MKILSEIQSELKAPKAQLNEFGGFNYRNAEDILQNLKPILLKKECAIILSDGVVNIGDRYYIKATASLYKDDKMIASASAFAREPESRKGQDQAQSSGSSSSYARKYAICGLFAIDNGGDPDTRKYEEPEKTHTRDEPITEDQLAELVALMMKADADEKKFCAHFKVKRVEHMPQSLYGKAIDALNAKIEKIDPIPAYPPSEG